MLSRIFGLFSIIHSGFINIYLDFYRWISTYQEFIGFIYFLNFQFLIKS